MHSEVAITKPVNSSLVRSDPTDAITIAEEKMYPFVSAVMLIRIGNIVSPVNRTDEWYLGDTLQNMIKIGTNERATVKTSKEFFFSIGNGRKDEHIRPVRSPQLNSKNVVSGTKYLPVKGEVFGNSGTTNTQIPGNTEREAQKASITDRDNCQQSQKASKISDLLSMKFTEIDVAKSSSAGSLSKWYRE